ncbi:kelch domain-containing protein 3 [Galendromus occidentalis]|uniref:Kelch domain-containing protein 3 n=1 Tax=Galendromus occidentalis TaxID=34638 RepID=A0AAJ7SI82_9ACAR|nr:kelch domain-containing protein 3 [Galendromus occidentalis]
MNELIHVNPLKYPPTGSAKPQLQRAGYKWIAHIRGGPKRVNHSAVLVGDTIFVFGGFCTGGNYFSAEPIDVFKLNTQTLQWQSVESPAELSKNVPFMRYGHAVVAHGNQVYLFGGRNDKGACNKLYRFDTTTYQWSLIPTTGCIPGPRDGHTACLIGSSIYVFGGFEEIDNCFSNDIFALDLNTFTWSFVEYKGTPLSHRDFHSACAIGTRMYIFGGRGDLDGPFHTDVEIYCNRLAYFDTETLRWCYPEKRGDIPPGRRSHSAFVYNGELYIFGGYESNKKLHYGNMYCFNPKTEVWREFPINVGRTGPPRARRRHASIIAGSRLFIFGGTSPMNDLERAAYLKSEKSTETDCLQDLKDFLTDHDDLHVLDFSPTLQTLCLDAVIEYELNTSFLPNSLQTKIRQITSDSLLAYHHRDRYFATR